MSDIAARVARGAAWLDEKYPSWYSKIDLSILDLGNCTQCVLGQVYTGVIPVAEQGQVLAQAIALVTSGYEDSDEWAKEYADEVASGQFGGYQILSDFHELPRDGEWHGFVAVADRAGGTDEETLEAERVEYQQMLDEWTRVIIERRLAEHPDVQALTVRLNDLREPVAA